MDRSSAFALLFVVAAGCRTPDVERTDAGGPAPAGDAARGDAATTATTATAIPARTLQNGASFPDGVVALTWDDGPDAHTVALARFLHEQHVAATFFVVHAWKEGVSEEPGRGKTVFATGAEHLPVLGELVALGHRVADHTENHVLLTKVPPGEAVRQLREAEAHLAGVRRSEVHFFRPPGGAWSADLARTLEASSVLDGLVGPIGWDVDAKDWECSLWCRSEQPDRECEPSPIAGEKRVRADVVAKRYEDRITTRRKGIVLLHDRVGDVGSRYALDVAKKLVPALVAKGLVFAPPVLAFGPMRPRVTALPTTGAPEAGARPGDVGEVLGSGDLNGDGRADACGLARDGVACALAKPGGGFTAATLWAARDALPASVTAATLRLADANGDGRADLCVQDGATVSCALAP